MSVRRGRNPPCRREPRRGARRLRRVGDIVAADRVSRHDWVGVVGRPTVERAADHSARVALARGVTVFEC
ncbi:MAG: hypothetical protein ACJ77D_04995, partial [Chloroflexota bacterium]